MSYRWEPQGIDLEHFSPKEFDRPELMDGGFLKELDTVRMRCGFPLRVTDDARNQEDLERIYAAEIAMGKDYPKESAHLYKRGPIQANRDAVPVRAVDIKPAPPKADDGCALTYPERCLELDYQILRMWKEGKWKHLGLGYETAHNHVDDTPRLGLRRPARWVQPSR